MSREGSRLGLPALRPRIPLLAPPVASEHPETRRLPTEPMRLPLLVLALCAASAACQTPPPVAPAEAYAQAVARADASDTDGALAALLVALDADSTTYQRALLDPAFADGLRDEEAFRDAMHAAAVQHGIHRLRLVPESEPGEWITVEGQVNGPDGAPVAGATVRLFATDAAGLYHPTLPGEERPRIFGTLVSDEEGRFTFETVRPGPYPGTRNPRHVHVGVRSADGAMRLAAPGYAVFSDDPLLFEPQNEEPREEALRIAMEEGGETGTLALPLR